MNFTKFSFSILCATLIYAEDSVQLDSIDVQGVALKADKQVFKQAKAVSAREDISNSTQNLDNIIRTIPGAFTNHRHNRTKYQRRSWAWTRKYHD